MPALSKHSSNRFVKFLFVGNSGAGKTGALTSLVKAGYNIRILDLDNGLDALKNHLLDECPERIDQVSYLTVRDAYKASSTGVKVVGSNRAFVTALQYLDNWEDDTKPADWGEETILVIDSLTNLGKSAFAWAKAMNPTCKDPRQWYSVAQEALDDIIANLTGEAFATNVIVISHIDYVTEASGIQKGFVSSVGKALGPKLPRFFNTMLLSETSGTGKNVKRKIKTMPTAVLDLKNPAPMKIDAEYDLGDGLAKIFSTLKGR